MWRRLKEIRRYPSAVVGALVIICLILISIYTVIAIPYGRAIYLWRGGPGVWDENPRNASPVWTDLFTPGRTPRTIIVNSANVGEKRVEPLGADKKSVQITLPFDYFYDGFPSEVTLFTQVSGAEGTRTRYAVFWRAPDGQSVEIIKGREMRATDSYYISQDGMLTARLGVSPQYGLFSDMSRAVPVSQRTPLHGGYALTVRSELPAEADLSAKLVVYGQIYGLAGTDHLRRDLMMPLLWGAPLALVFGILAAVGAVLSTFVLAGIASWFRGWVDGLFERLTEINMIIPLLPILIMIGQFYSRSIWLMLGVIIALSVFSAGMKTYRAMFLQAREAPYIEAAQAYGAGNFRIIFRYLLPRMVPVILPTLVTLIPTFVFLEASLAVIGLGDPLLPTWGKIISDARSQGALYKGYYYWVVEPAVLLMLTGFAFAMVGYALDRVFNPRLRTV